MKKFISILLGSLLTVTSIAAFSQNANAADFQRQHNNINRNLLAFDHTKSFSERQIREQRTRELSERQIHEQRARELRERQIYEQRARELRQREANERQSRKYNNRERQQHNNH